MNVVIYARYSSHGQKEESIEGQLKECYNYARKNDYIVIDEYIDRALSGTNDNRVQFQKMIADSKNKNFEGVPVLPHIKRTIDEKENMLTLFPHINGTDGFFISAFRRVD